MRLTPSAMPSRRREFFFCVALKSYLANSLLVLIGDKFVRVSGVKVSLEGINK